MQRYVRTISKAFDEAKSQADYARKMVGNLETRKWSTKKKSKMRSYHVNTADENEETVSWGSDFSDSCSDDAEDGEIEEEEEGDGEGEGEGEEEEDYEDGLSSNRVTRCGSYSLCETDSSSQPHTESISGSTTYENTYEAISETPSTSSYCGSSENSSAFYETPPERRRDSVTTCPSDTDKSTSSGIGHDHVTSEYEVKNDRTLSTESIIREVNQKRVPQTKSILADSTNSVLSRSVKPNDPSNRKKVSRKIVRPANKPPPPPLPKSPPPPLSPTLPKMSIADRINKLSCGSVNESLKTQTGNVKSENKLKNTFPKKLTFIEKDSNLMKNFNNMKFNVHGTDCNAKVDGNQSNETNYYETPITIKVTKVTNNSNGNVNKNQIIPNLVGSRSSSVSSSPINPDSGFSDCTGSIKSGGSTSNLNTTSELPKTNNSATLTSTSGSTRSKQISSNNHDNLTKRVTLTNGRDIDRPKLPRCTKESISGTSLGAELAAKLTGKAMNAKKFLNPRSTCKVTETNQSNNNDNCINRSSPTFDISQRPLPPLPNDDTMPIEKYSWYHDVEREAASRSLSNLAIDGGYMVRPSKRSGDSYPYALTIIHSDKLFHLSIRQRSDGLYSLGKEKDKEKAFSSVAQLIRFHQKEPILLATKGEYFGNTKLMVTPTRSPF